MNGINSFRSAPPLSEDNLLGLMMRYFLILNIVCDFVLKLGWDFLLSWIRCVDFYLEVSAREQIKQRTRRTQSYFPEKKGVGTISKRAKETEERKGSKYRT